MNEIARIVLAEAGLAQELAWILGLLLKVTLQPIPPGLPGPGQTRGQRFISLPGRSRRCRRHHLIILTAIISPSQCQGYLEPSSKLGQCWKIL